MIYKLNGPSTNPNAISNRERVRTPEYKARAKAQKARRKERKRAIKIVKARVLLTICRLPLEEQMDVLADVLLEVRERF